jgi:hypothetical protein
MAKKSHSAELIEQVSHPAILEAINGYKPVVEARYVEHVNRLFKNIVEAFKGDTTLKGVFSSTWYKVFKSTIQPNLGQTRVDVPMEPWNTKFHYHVDNERLAKNASKYADEVLANWIKKINAKLGKLDEAKVVSLDGCRFTIDGKRNGHTVFIQQEMIINHRGYTMFNQFPSRIYLDGKYVSELEYKKLMLTELRAA